MQLPTFDSSLVWRNMRRAKGGMACLFIPINPTAGYKLFINRAARDRSYNRQSRAAKINVAPAVGKCFQVTDIALYHAVEKERRSQDSGHSNRHKGNSRTLYGYVTQKAQMRRMSFENVCYVEARLHDIGLTSSDYQAYCDGRYINVGFVNNKPVCIDFDI